MSVPDALAVALAANVPVLLWGPPGSGKTSVVTAIATALDVPCETVIASIREPSDFAGLPVVANGSVTFAPPRWAERLAAAPDGHAVLFLDELSTAPPAVQAALLRVVLDRTVGDLALPAAVRVVAAANPPDEAADGWELAPPLANRFVHLNWQPEASTVADGFVSGFAVPAVVLPPHGWEQTQLPRARAAIAAFLRARPSIVSVLPKPTESNVRAFPTPRSWDAAARLSAACDAAGTDDDTRNLLVAGCVGTAAAIELRTYLRQLDLPDPEALLAAPADVVLPTRGDQLYAVLAAVVAAVQSDLTLDRWRAAWKIVARGAGDTPDIAAVAARTLAANRPPGATMPAEVKAFAPLLAAAGKLVASA